jgi:4-alpha-methyl-delta7-sterol-4alpha-methyl oxidase
VSLWFAAVVMPPLVSLGSYLLLGALYTLPHRFARLGGRRLQTKAPPFGPTLRRGLRHALVNGAAAFALSLTLWPLYQLRGVHLGPWPAWWAVLGQLALFLVVDDALFYALHRTLHTRWLFRRVHAVHHRVHAPFALTGAIMHPLEWVAIGGLVMVVPLAIGMHAQIMWLCVILRQWGNAEFHAGMEGWWSVLSRLPGAGGVRHHDLHHARMAGNYAALFSFWDRRLGTELAAR